MHELVAQMVSLLNGESLAIDTHHGFSVGLAQMNPAVGEVYLQSVGLTDMGALVFREAVFHLLENGLYICIRHEVDGTLGYLIVGERGPQLSSATMLTSSSR